MDDAEGKVESSNETSNDATTSEKDVVADLNSQIVELKREHEALKKKLHKAEFERDSARKNAENLKSEVKELSKKLQEERKRNAESKQKSCNALQQNESIQGTCKLGILVGRTSHVMHRVGRLMPRSHQPLNMFKCCLV